MSPKASSGFSSCTRSPCVEVRRLRPALGTLVAIAAGGREAARVAQAIDAAFAAVELTERLMSFHSADSELSRLNRSANRRPQKVHAWTFAVLRRAARIASLSEGLFDPTVAPVLLHAGLLPGSGLPAAQRDATWRDLRLQRDSHVFYARPMLLDLGGIAKGFAVDQAIHALRRRGCSQGFVNAGGDLRRFGPGFEPVRVRTRDGTAPLAELRCGAIGTSAARAVHAGRLAQPIGAIVDPRNRKLWHAAGGGVSVAAPSCTVADALTKVAALAGPACRPLLERFGAQAYWWTDAAGCAPQTAHAMVPRKRW
jgi:thiamine biosynthesis lipoprotein